MRPTATPETKSREVPGPHGLSNRQNISPRYLIAMVVPIVKDRPRAGANVNCSL